MGWEAGSKASQNQAGILCFVLCASVEHSSIVLEVRPSRLDRSLSLRVFDVFVLRLMPLFWPRATFCPAEVCQSSGACLASTDHSIRLAL